MRRVFLKKVPICEKSESNSNIQNEIAILVEKILILKESEAVSAGLAERRRLEKQITEAETEIDRLVYQLYGLTEREIRIIEGMEKEGGGG